MADNTERFTGRVREYTQFRREYPAPKIVDWLRVECGLDSSWQIADLAAGTGMLSTVFLRNGNAVIAVEPNAAMRAACETLCAAYPHLRVVDGTAESTGLRSASVSMVTAGRAFHWFEPTAAMAEFRRILQPGGWVVLIASGRKPDHSRRGQEFEHLLTEYGTDPDYGLRRGMREAGCGDFLRGLGRGGYRRVIFDESWPVNLETFRGMVQSVSCAPLRDDARYPAMQRALEAFFTRWSEQGMLRWTEQCVVEAGRLDSALDDVES